MPSDQTLRKSRRDPRADSQDCGRGKGPSPRAPPRCESCGWVQRSHPGDGAANLTSVRRYRLDGGTSLGFYRGRLGSWAGSPPHTPD